MDKIRELLKENGIKIAVINVETKAFYLPEENTIFIDEKLNSTEQEWVALHEARHALNHSDYQALYDKFVYHTKMENDADEFMISSLINETDGHFNYSMVIEEFNLGIGWEQKIRRN